MSKINDLEIHRFSSVHDLSDRHFALQKQKFLDHGRTGGVVGVLLTTSSRVVLIRRTGLHAGWALPGGTLEEGEAPETAFRREIMEELGLLPNGLQLSLVEEKVFRSPTHEELKFDLYVFTGYLDVDFEEMEAPESEVDIARIKAFEYGCLPEAMILSDRAKLEMLRKFVENGLENAEK